MVPISAEHDVQIAVEDSSVPVTSLWAQTRLSASFFGQTELQAECCAKLLLGVVCIVDV